MTETRRWSRRPKSCSTGRMSRLARSTAWTATIFATPFAFQQVNGLPVSGGLDATTWGALKRDGAPVLKAYTITLPDAAGPFTRAIPSNLEAMAGLPGLSYTSATSSLRK